jgi:hypothetical protein
MDGASRQTAAGPPLRTREQGKQLHGLRAQLERVRHGEHGADASTFRERCFHIEGLEPLSPGAHVQDLKK